MNEMKISGKVISAAVETKGQYTIQTAVIETEGQYPKKVAVEVFGEDRIKQLNIVEGETITVDINLESREWQGRWFTTARAWRVDRGASQPQAPAPAAAPADILSRPASNGTNAVPQGGASTSLPF